MSRRRHAQLHLPRLSPREALAVVTALQRAIAAIVRAHGDDMNQLVEMQHREALARRHGCTIYNLHNLDFDPDVDF